MRLSDISGPWFDFGHFFLTKICEASKVFFKISIREKN